MESKTNPNDPAHPTKVDGFENDLPGLTKREEFAVNAPDKIPDWFKHISADEPEKPKSWSDYPEDFPFREEMRSWQNDPSYDLDEELSDFQKSWEKYREDLVESLAKDKQSRYFQWRTFYADSLIEQLNK